jgi:hypothetical protein
LEALEGLPRPAGIRPVSDATDFVPCVIRRLVDGERLVIAAVENAPADPRASALADRTWGAQGVRLTVSFIDAPPPDLESLILWHMNSWGEYANVRFDFTQSPGQVRISRAMDGHWSYLGTDILLVPDHEPTMNLHDFTLRTPEAEMRRVVRHQTGHTLGFRHRHLRRSLVERLVEGKAIDFYAATQGWNAEQTRARLLTPTGDASLAETEADSIMCYEIPGALTVDGLPIRGGDDINARDASFAAACYPAKS